MAGLSFSGLGDKSFPDTRHGWVLGLSVGLMGRGGMWCGKNWVKKGRQMTYMVWVIKSTGEDCMVAWLKSNFDAIYGCGIGIKNRCGKRFRMRLLWWECGK